MEGDDRWEHVGEKEEGDKCGFWNLYKMSTWNCPGHLPLIAYTFHPKNNNNKRDKITKKCNYNNISTISVSFFCCFFCHSYVSSWRSAVMLIFLAHNFFCLLLMKQFATRCHVQIMLAVKKEKGKNKKAAAVWTEQKCVSVSWQKSMGWNSIVSPWRWVIDKINPQAENRRLPSSVKKGSLKKFK